MQSAYLCALTLAFQLRGGLERSGRVWSLRGADPHPTTQGSAVVVGAVRDAAPSVGHALEQLDALCRHFNPCTILVYENDSTDGTVGVLKNFRASAGVNFSLLSRDPAPVAKSRTRRLARIRNLLLERAGDLDYEPDYLFVSDMDDCMSASPTSSVLRALRTQQAWDVVSFDRGDYYDSWALRCRGAEHNSQGLPAESTVASMRMLVDRACEACKAGLRGGRGRKVVVGNDTYAPVYSAFNSFAIYKFAITKGCEDTYSGENRDSMCARDPYCVEKGDCEHVSFHDCLRIENKARIMIADWELDPPLKKGGCGPVQRNHCTPSEQWLNQQAPRSHF